MRKLLFSGFLLFAPVGALAQTGPGQSTTPIILGPNGTFCMVSTACPMPTSGGGGGGTVNQGTPNTASNAWPVVVIPAGNGLGTDESANPPTQLTQLKSGTVVHPGQLYVQNESATVLQLWLQGATAPILIGPGGANQQGGDWQAAANMPWFVGTFTINGTSGSQFFANTN